MEIKELFKGIAVVIDDQVNSKGSSISKIVTFLKDENIPVVAYDEIPSVNVISSLQNASFVILDWEYNNIGEKLTEGEERVIKPSSLEGEIKVDLLNFMKQILSNIFVPIFLFTDQEPDSIKETLKSRGIYFDNKPNRVFIKSKSELNTYDELINAIKIWIQQMPSVYVLKKWEKALNSTKNKMFLEMYGYSPNWIHILRDILKNDSIEYNQEFGEFLTKNITNRIGAVEFADEYFTDIGEKVPEELAKVMEGERYISYGENNTPTRAYTGDLFKKSGKYYLNIRAQCDLARDEDPILYVISGKKLSVNQIVTGGVVVHSDGVLQIGDKNYTLDELSQIISDDKALSNINADFKKVVSGNIFYKGAIMERANEVIIACIDGKEVVKFDIKLCAKPFSELKDQRIGRVLPPHITRIQQKCAQHMIREGTIPLPQDIFN